MNEKQRSIMRTLKKLEKEYNDIQAGKDITPTCSFLRKMKEDLKSTRS